MRDAREIILRPVVTEESAMLQETPPKASARRSSGSGSSLRARLRAASTQRTLRSQRSSAYAASDENPSSKCAPRPITSSTCPSLERNPPSARASVASTESSCSTVP